MCFLARLSCNGTPQVEAPLLALRPLLILSSEIEFHQHDILPKCSKTMKVYAQWQDVKGSDPPSPLAARRNREAYAQTQAYYKQINGYSSKGIDSYLRSLRAGHCFNFPGGHSFPFSAQMVTTS